MERYTEGRGRSIPEDKYQRNVFSKTSKGEAGGKGTQSNLRPGEQESNPTEGQGVVEELREMKLKEAAKKVEDGIEETLTYCDFPSEHWIRICTNNAIERLNREIRRRTRVVDCFPDGNSVLMLICARLHYVAGTHRVGIKST